MIGQVVAGKYEILRLVGEGGMGAVYEARHKTTGRLAALKVISGNDITANPTLTARFEREAQAAAKVTSPHIVEILDAGHDAVLGHPYMVMELLVGMNVQRALKTLGPLPPALAIRIAVQTLFGLEKAHAAGVVHRDVKPANLFLCEGEGGERVVKLLDFGLAKFKMDQATEEGVDGLTRTGSVLGSPMFMAPEQARGLKSIDHRADLWSLGIVLYQLLSGKTPHAGIEGVGELIITICSDEPAPLRQRAPWISPALEKAVHGVLKLAPAARYQSAAEMRAALLPCLDDVTKWHIHSTDFVRLTDEQRLERPSALADVEEGEGATLAFEPVSPLGPAQSPAARGQVPPARPLGAAMLPAAGQPVLAKSSKEQAHNREGSPLAIEAAAETRRGKRRGGAWSIVGVFLKGLVAIGLGVGLGVLAVGFVVGRLKAPSAPPNETPTALVPAPIPSVTSSSNHEVLPPVPASASAVPSALLLPKTAPSGAAASGPGK